MIPVAVMMECPKCGAEQEDFDGMGFPYCDECGYCAHFSRTGNAAGALVCDCCGDIENSECAKICE